MEGKLSSCGGLVNTQAGVHSPPVQWGEDQKDKGEKEGMCWGSSSLAREAELDRQGGK